MERTRKEVKRMAKLTLQQLYLGDKYNIIGEVFKDFWSNGSPDPKERTGLELLIVKHTILAMEKLKNEGDCIADLESVL